MQPGMDFGDRHQHLNHLRPSMSQGSQQGRFEEEYMNGNMNMNFPFNYQNQGAINRQYSYGSSMGDQFNLLNQISVSALFCNSGLCAYSNRVTVYSCLILSIFLPFILLKYSNTHIIKHNPFPITKQVQNISHHLIQIFSWLANYLKSLHQAIHQAPIYQIYTMMPCFLIITGRPGMQVLWLWPQRGIVHTAQESNLLPQKMQNLRVPRFMS
jgi:hypothetical protein